MATGGNSNVETERLNRLEREVTGIGTDVKYLVKTVDNINQVVATKAEVSALEKRVMTIEEKEKNSKVNMISGISAVTAMASVIVAVWAVIHG